MADKTIGGEGQIDTEELERYLCRWCYNNGTPFTTITYSVDGGLSIKEDDVARRLYEQAFPYHDEPLLDADGNIVGVQTVANAVNGTQIIHRTNTARIAEQKKSARPADTGTDGANK